MAESPLDGVEVDWKLAELRAMVGAGELVLQIARYLAKKIRFGDDRAKNSHG